MTPRNHGSFEIRPVVDSGESGSCKPMPVPESETGETVYLGTNVIADNSDIAAVEFGKNVVGLDVVRISLKTAAAERMREATQGNGGLLALIPEGELLCTPYISGDISGELEINLALNHLQMIEAALRSDMAKE